MICTKGCIITAIKKVIPVKNFYLTFNHVIFFNFFWLEDDLDNVLKRAFANHVEKLIITGTTLEDSKEVLEIANKNGVN